MRAHLLALLAALCLLWGATANPTSVNLKAMSADELEQLQVDIAEVLKQQGDLAGSGRALLVQEEETTTGRALLQEEEDDAEGDDDAEGEDDAGGEDDEEEPEGFSGGWKKISFSVFLIITALITITVIFEIGKDYVLENCAKESMPIINTMFSEMTVLGFLGLITFAIGKLQVLTDISETVFSNEEAADTEEGECNDECEEYLPELFESVHMILFMVMAIFVISVLGILYTGHSASEDWQQLNKDAQNESLVREMWEELSHMPRPGLFEFDLRRRRRAIMHKLEFVSLRQEFIEGRDPLTTEKHPADSDAILPDSFDFGKYLAIRLGLGTAEIVELPVYTWAALWLMVTLFFCIQQIAGEASGEFIIWFWAAVGYCWALMIRYMTSYVANVRAMLVNPGSFPASIHDQSLLPTPVTGSPSGVRKSNNGLSLSGNGGAAGESKSGDGTGSVGYGAMSDEVDATKPGWCHTLAACDMPKRSKLRKFCCGKAPNRQEMLFWAEENGREFHLFLIRLTMLFSSVYVSILCVEFGSEAVRLYDSLGALYIILALLPVGYIAWNLTDLIASCVLIQNTGILRQPSTIKEVVRHQKTARCIKALLLLNNLRVHFQKKKRGSVSAGAGEATDRVVPSEVLDEEQINEISKTFDLYDDDGGGEIDAGELRALMGSLGHEIDDVEAKEMLIHLDLDGDGTVSKEEFIQWHAEQANSSNNQSPKELATQLFAMFDDDGSGSITVGEFKDALDKLGSDLSVDEIADLVKELDEDNSGTIEEHEFAELLEKHSGSELL